MEGKMPLKSKTYTDNQDMVNEISPQNYSNSCLAKVINLMPDAVIVINADDVITRVNQTVCSLLGYDESELVDQTLSLIITSSLPSNLAIQSLRDTGTASNIRLSFSSRDSGKIPMRATACILESNDGESEERIIVAKNLAKLSQPERLRRLEHAISRLLAESESSSEIIKQFLQTCCESLEWVYGGFWQFDKHSQVIRRVESWSTSALYVKDFIKASDREGTKLHGKHLKKGGGLMRQAYLTGETAWIENISKETSFHRGPEAAKVGLNSAVAFPIRVGNLTLGIVEFFHGHIDEPNTDLRQTFQTIGFQIGQFMKHQHAEAQHKMEHLITRILGETETTNEAMRKIIQSLCEALGWDHGNYWETDKKKQLMWFAATWCLPTLKIDEFVQISSETTLPPPPGINEKPPVEGGVVRRACISRKPVWFADVTGDKTFWRGQVAAKVGLHAAFSFPIIAGSEVIGAFEFYSKDIRQPDSMLLETVEAIGLQIGMLFKRKEAEQVLIAKTRDLEKSNQELNQFAYITSHDLKAPLRAIANLSQWLEEDLGDDLSDEVSNHLKLLNGRVHRMEGLIEGILQYSRIGRVAVEIETVDTGILLKEIVDSLPVPVEFSIDIDAGMPVFQTEQTRFSQVFSNLISNAIKYHDREDGHVQVSMQDGGEFYTFSVTDDGPGIAPEYHEKVFVIFQTLEARDKVESTGIGLSVVKKIIEDRGGSIELDSEEGRGATFCFTWPKGNQ